MSRSEPTSKRASGISSLARRIERAVLFLALVSVVIGPQIPALGQAGDTISLASLILIGFFLAGRDRNLLEHRHVFELALLLGIIAAYSALVVGASEKFDPYYLLRAVRVLVNFFGAVSLVGLYDRQFGHAAPTKLLVHTFAAISTSAVIIIAEFTFPSFRAAVYAVTQPSIDSDNLLYRMAGLTAGAGASGSFLQFVGILLGPSVWVYYRSAWWKATILACMVLNFVACMLTGRTGIYFSLLFVPVSLVWTAIKSRRREHPMISDVKSNLRRNILHSLVAMVLIATTLIVIWNPIVDYLQSDGLAPAVIRAYSRSAESFLSYKDTGTLHEQTVEALLTTHMKSPHDPLTFLFGDAQWTRETVRSDIGYVKMWFGLGLVGTLLIVGFYCMLIESAWRHRAAAPVLSRTSIMLSASLLLAHGKEPFLLTRFYFSVSLILALAILLQSRAAAQLSSGSYGNPRA
jgi:hypothetical protein